MEKWVLNSIFLILILSPVYAQDYSYSATHQSACIEGDRSCEVGNTELWICKADGNYLKETCKYGCTTLGTPRCLSQIETEEITTNNSISVNTILIGISIIIGLIIVGLLLKRRNNRN